MVWAMPFRFQMFGRITIIVWRVISSQTVQKLSSQPFHKLGGLVVHEISSQVVHEHPAINPMQVHAASPYMVALHTARNNIIIILFYIKCSITASLFEAGSLFNFHHFQQV